MPNNPNDPFSDPFRPGRQAAKNASDMASAATKRFDASSKAAFDNATATARDNMARSAGWWKRSAANHPDGGAATGGTGGGAGTALLVLLVPIGVFAVIGLIGFVAYKLLVG